MQCRSKMKLHELIKAWENQKILILLPLVIPLIILFNNELNAPTEA
jgi:hypothetical protein